MGKWFKVLMGRRLSPTHTEAFTRNVEGEQYQCGHCPTMEEQEAKIEFGNPVNFRIDPGIGKSELIGQRDRYWEEDDN